MVSAHVFGQSGSCPGSSVRFVFCSKPPASLGSKLKCAAIGLLALGLANAMEWLCARQQKDCSVPEHGYLHQQGRAYWAPHPTTAVDEILLVVERRVLRRWYPARPRSTLSTRTAEDSHYRLFEPSVLPLVCLPSD
jgi:hypothetical protein